MRYMLWMTACLAGALGAAGDIIYTADGRSLCGIATPDPSGGYQVLLMDGTRKYFTQEQVSRVDTSDRTAQMFFGAAENLDLAEKGGIGYLWLGYWIEKVDKGAAALLYTIALQDDEAAPIAAHFLSKLSSQLGPHELASYLRLAAVGSPFVDAQDMKRLQAAIEQANAAVRTLDRTEVTVFYNLVKDIARNRLKTAAKLWADFTGGTKTPTKQFLERLCKTYTGYDFALVNQEMLYIVGSADKKLWQCETCKGTGKVECSRCKGLGYFPCEKCQGKGTISKSVYSAATQTTTTISQKCGACNGEGYTLCGVCRTYTQYMRVVRISLPGGAKNVKLSGYKTCPDCGGSGRKAGAPDLSGKITSVGLNSADTRAAFLNLESQVWRLLSSETSWGATLVRNPSSADFARDIRTVPYRFHGGRWLAPTAIDEMIAKGAYTPPKADPAAFAEYKAQLASLLIPAFSKVAETLSGRDRDKDNLSDLVSYYEFISGAGETATQEFRKLFKLTFKKTADANATDAYRPGADPELLLRMEQSGKLTTVYCVRIAENAAAAVSQLLENAAEITLLGRIISVTGFTTTSPDSLTVQHTIELSPFAAVVKAADGKSIQWVKTETAGRTTSVAAGAATEEEN